MKCKIKKLYKSCKCDRQLTGPTIVKSETGWKVQNVRAHFSRHNSPNSRAVADRSGRESTRPRSQGFSHWWELTERLWSVNTSSENSCVPFIQRTDWSDRPERTNGKRSKLNIQRRIKPDCSRPLSFHVGLDTNISKKKSSKFLSGNSHQNSEISPKFALFLNFSQISIFSNVF